MLLADIAEINRLFTPCYPFIARQILDELPWRQGLVLEIGPYAGGISVELARLCSGLRFIIGDNSPEIMDYLRGEVAESGLGGRVQLCRLQKTALPFAQQSVHLVVFRGGLFFWEAREQILQEVARVLLPGGVGMVGGGFGRDTPEAVIASIADRARELNLRLGKHSLSPQQAAELIKLAGQEQPGGQSERSTGQTRIDTQHGLWIILRP